MPAQRQIMRRPAPRATRHARLLADQDALDVAMTPCRIIATACHLGGTFNPRSFSMITDRSEVTSMIRAAKVQRNISWTGVAAAIGQSKEWTTAGCLGQMAFSKAQAEKIGAIFGLSNEALAWLQIAPHKGSLPTAVPADPLIYRWYEIVAVYGTTIKELIHEEFGDGIMSAIDFSMDISREADPKGDRVKVVMSGKFLPYKAY
jgi:cyanate lyase